MKAKINTIGCDEQYGEERVVLDDELLGELSMREIEFDDLNELQELLDDVDQITMEPSHWSEYDAEITALCGNV